MGKRSFTREFKLEAVKLVRERGVNQAQVARDLGIHYNVLRKWVKDAASDAAQAFPGRGKMRPDDAEVARLRRELAQAKAERDILKKGDCIDYKSNRRATICYVSHYRQASHEVTFCQMNIQNLKICQGWQCSDAPIDDKENPRRAAN